MNTEQIKALLKNHPGVDDAIVEGDGKHYELTIVSDVFEGQTKVKRQLWVYALLNEHIVSGQLHAIQMNTWTNAEWEKQRG